ncbi:MAG: hypothetical protein JXQ29_01830 [Planctomycetes bacterium]|nr:hypothetical protein [Planctomycetota bacterium]
MHSLRFWMTALLLATVLAGAAAEGQNYAYATDSNLNVGGCNAFPFASTSTSWRYQIIFAAKYLPGRPVLVTDLGFGACMTSPPLFQASEFQIRFAHNTVGTLTSTYDNNFSMPPVTLFYGPITWQAVYLQWQDLGLTAPFAYDGQNHIVIEIRYRGRTSASTSMRSDPNMPRVYISSGTDPYTAITGTLAANYGLKTRLTYIEAAILTLAGSPQPGGTVDLLLDAPAAAGKPYQMASSLGTGPIILGSRSIGLSLDDLLVLTVGNYLPAVFANYAGLLDAQGKARAQIRIPNNPALKGVRIYSAFVTLDALAPLGIDLISNTVTLSIQ